MSYPTVPIGMVFSVANGATPKSGEEDLWDGDIPWITPADLGKNVTAEIASGARSITRKGLNSCGTQIVPADSIVLSIRAPIGHTAIAAEPLCFNQGCRGLVPSKKVLTKFGYWAVLSAKPTLQSAGQGTTFQELGRDRLRAVRIPLPDLATQRQIADFLDRETARIDLLIEKKQRLVALLGEKRSETVRQCVSWGMDPSVAKKPSRVPAGDDLAAHWSEQRLSTICRFVQGKAHEPFIEDDGEYMCVTARFVSTNGEKFRRCTKNLTPGKVNDIAMVMSDLPNGRALAKAFLVEQDDLYAINQRVCAITVMEGDPRFFFYQLDRNFQLLRYNDGFNQTHLPNRAFTQLFLKVPPVEEQSRIADYLDAICLHTNALTEKTNASIDRLKEYRSALITAAVTGQINVSTYTKSGTPDRRLDAIQEEMDA